MKQKCFKCFLYKIIKHPIKRAVKWLLTKIYYVYWGQQHLQREGWGWGKGAGTHNSDPQSGESWTSSGVSPSPIFFNLTQIIFVLELLVSRPK